MKESAFLSQRARAARRRCSVAAALALLGTQVAPAQDEPAAQAPVEAAPTATPELPAAPADEGARRDAAEQTLVRLIEEKRYAEAVEIAAQIVDLATRLHGGQSLELADPLTNLATAQMNQGDLVNAESNYRAAITLIERADGPGSPRLANPLVGLAETYMRGGLYQQANDAYKRALQINHAAAGFYNLEQLRIRDGLSESYLGLDKLSQANAQQRIQVAIQRRRSGANSPDVTPALYKLGRWYNRTGQYVESREAYQEARRIIRDAKGDDDPALVDALIGEALSYGNEGAVPASVSTLRRALDVLDAQPEPDHLKRAEVLVALGDLHIVFRRPGAAHERYAEAWKELSTDQSLTEQRDVYFGRPSRITGPRLPEVVGAEGLDQAGPRDGSAIASGFVLARFVVDAEGAARDAVIIESDPPGMLDEKVLRALAGTTFRPRLVEGQIVATEGVQFRHDFRYLRSAKPPQRPAPGSAPAGEKGEPIVYPGQSDEPAGG